MNLTYSSVSVGPRPERWCGAVGSTHLMQLSLPEESRDSGGGWAGRAPGTELRVYKPVRTGRQSRAREVSQSCLLLVETSEKKRPEIPSVPKAKKNFCTCPILLFKMFQKGQTIRSHSAQRKSSVSLEHRSHKTCQEVISHEVTSEVQENLILRWPIITEHRFQEIGGPHCVPET